ncbi:primase-helicase family protein [Massilia putida]|uniref:primase-helicase family protein n=1 Tax=Massilia putida TaxID=1141883 RepID=UPI0009531DC7|nr:primase-helicase family protein [Massilia putida]
MPPQQTNEIIDQYANYLKNEGYVLSMGANSISLLHAPSSYYNHLKEIDFGFPAWARLNKAYIEANEYAEFMSSLQVRVMERLPRVVGRGMRPTDERVYRSQRGAMLANTYTKYRPACTSEFVMPAILQDYLDRLFPDAQEQKTVVEFAADIVQNPELRPQWSLLLTGDQGSGKSSLVSLIRTALDERYVWSGNSYTPVFEKFSEVLPDNLVICFDDAPSHQDTYEKLKRAITCAEVEVEIKGQQNRVEREVYARIMICSNNPRPLRLERGDRRFYCPAPCKHRTDADETAQFFEQFLIWKEQNREAIYQWLASVDLKDFVRGSCKKTATHTSMVDMSASVLDDAVASFIEDKSGMAFHPKELYAHLRDQGIPTSAVDLIKSSVAKAGYETKRRNIDGIKGQIYIFARAGFKRSGPLTENEIESIFKAHHQSF